MAVGQAGHWPNMAIAKWPIDIGQIGPSVKSTLAKYGDRQVAMGPFWPMAFGQNWRRPKIQIFDKSVFETAVIPIFQVWSTILSPLEVQWPSDRLARVFSRAQKPFQKGTHDSVPGLLAS